GPVGWAWPWRRRVWSFFRSLLRSADDQRVSLPTTAAQRRRADAQAAALQLVREGQDQARAAGADRVSQRDGAAVDVDAVLVDRQHPRRIQRHRGERLVDLDQVEVVNFEAGLLQRVAQGQGRHCVQPRVPVGAHAVGDDLDQRLGAKLPRTLLRHDDDGGRTVRDLRRVAGGDRPVLLERRRELAQRFDSRLGTYALIAIELEHRNHLVLQRSAVRPRAGGTLVRTRGPCVLVLAAQLELLVDLIRALAHVL